MIEKYELYDHLYTIGDIHHRSCHISITYERFVVVIVVSRSTSVEIKLNPAIMCRSSINSREHLLFILRVFAFLFSLMKIALKLKHDRLDVCVFIKLLNGRLKNE